MPAGLDWRGVWGWANTLSTDPPTGIVGKQLNISDMHIPVGAAARCDLLTLILKIKRSQPRFTRQLLQGSLYGIDTMRERTNPL
jgi:hypothetical protein